MKIDLSAVPREFLDDDPRVGDVYPAQGGPGQADQRTAMWIVIGVRNRSVVCMGVNTMGEIVSATSYQSHTFERRRKIGRCPDVENMILRVEPMP